MKRKKVQMSVADIKVRANPMLLYLYGPLATIRYIIQFHPRYAPLGSC